MIRIAIIETNPANREKLRNFFLEYTIQKDVDLDVLWFVEDITVQKVQRCATGANIAIISSASDPKRDFAKAIYQINEDCRILYYSESEMDLEPLLCVRPRGFHLLQNGKSIFTQKLEEIMEELSASKRLFYYETRKSTLLIPLSRIVYFQSDLKYVIIHGADNKTEKIYAKLADVEPGLPDTFLRVHKSYILNSTYVLKMDKSMKTIVLKNGEELPVSDAHYKKVTEYFYQRSK